MKKKNAIILAVLVIVAGIAGKLILDWFNGTYIIFNGDVLRRDVTVLDCSGKELKDLEKLEELTQLQELNLRQTGITVEQYDKLHAALPQCEISWSVPFQEGYVEMDAESVMVTSLSEADVQRMKYMENLVSVDASGCQDYDVLMALKESRPDVAVSYLIQVGDAEYAGDSKELTLQDADPARVTAALPYLNQLECVTFTGNVPDEEQIYQWMHEYGEVRFDWDIDVCGITVNSLATEMVISGIPADQALVDRLNVVLKYMPNLKTVVFSDETPGNEQMYQWKCEYPDIQFSWNFEVCGVATNSLATELILSNVKMKTTEAVEASLKYFYNLQMVEMCDCGIPSEEMDALWKRHPETRFVWAVYVARCRLRTDATTFMPYKYGNAGELVYTDRDAKELGYCIDLICMDLGHMKLRNYSFLENMPKLQYLILADTKGSDFSALVHCTELVYLELFVTEFSQTDVLVGMTKLEDLNLTWTLISDIEPLKQMTWLKRLWMGGTFRVSDEAKAELAEALPNTQIVHGEDSTGYGWRTGKRYYEQRDLLGMHYMG